MDLVQEVGAYAGLAAVVGLAVLSALYFSQARDLKRLREWAGRAPERTAEAQARAQQAPQGAVRPLPAKPGQPVAAAQPAKPGQPQPGAKPPTPAPKAQPGAPAAAPAAAGAAAKPAEPGKPAEQPAKPGEPGKAPPAPGRPAPATAAAAAAGAAAKPAQSDGADDKTKVPDPAKPVAPQPAGGAAPATNGTDQEIKASPGPGQAPKVAAAAAAAGAAPASASAVSKAPPPPKPPPPRPAAARPAAAQGRPAPPKPPGPPRPQTAVLPAQGPPPEDTGGWLPAPRYIALLIAGVLVVGAGATYAATELLGQDDEKSKAGQADEQKANAPDDGEATNPEPTQRIDPGSVTVAVLNGTTVEGLARRISDKVANAGFQKGNVTNAQNLEGSRAESVVLYASGAKAEARVVADKLGISQIEEIDSQSQGLAGNATVVVIVGQDQA